MSQKGNIASKWVYADWTNPTHRCWKDIMLETSSAPKQQFHYCKDAADHALIMDAIELICTSDKINAICIVSSDGGFAGLAQRISEKGLHVMAFGKKDTPAAFRKACHNFVYVENIGCEDNQAGDAGDDAELDKLLLDAYWQLVGDNDSIYLGDLGTKLKQLDSAFDPRSYGSASLKKLIINKTTQLEIHDVRDDRCYVRLANAIGTVKATPKKGKGFAFIVCQGEEFYFRKDDLMDEKDWSQIKLNQQVYFQKTSKHHGPAPGATNIKIV
ncbi:NYN domain-containing protein (plasmid) [Vibrio lentus]|nr:NYN domain-containing protein [Vibrio lentus]